MKKLRFLLLPVVLMLVVSGFVHAQENSSTVNSKIQELQQKVTELQGQENTLSNKIASLNSQINLTMLRIDSIKSDISKLDTEMDALSAEIERLELIKTQRLQLLLHRIPETYKRMVLPDFGAILLSKNFSDLLSRVKYLLLVQNEDTQLYKQLQNTQDTYGERKSLREKKKEQRQAFQVQLEQQSWELDQQKQEKQALLNQTKNSEAVYQTLLSQALAEKAALDRALVDSVSVGPVKQGDPIALVGNTGYPGCSTGAHLHFEVHKNGAWVDPGEYLSPKNVVDDQNGGNANLGHGSWPWPLEDSIRIEQYFGKTPWSWRYSYSGGIHTGYDLISTSSDVIRAPKDGSLYASSESCGSSIIKIKYIDHGDGVISFYLHVQ